MLIRDSRYVAMLLQTAPGVVVLHLGEARSPTLRVCPDDRSVQPHAADRPVMGVAGSAAFTAHVLVGRAAIGVLVWPVSRAPGTDATGRGRPSAGARQRPRTPVPSPR